MSYNFRMEALIDGEWKEVGLSDDRNEARFLLNTYYKEPPAVRILDEYGQLVEFKDRDAENGAQQAAAINFFRGIIDNARRDVQQFRREMMGEWASDRNRLFTEEMLNERPVQVTSQREYQRQMERYENRQSRLSRFGFVNERPNPAPPNFVRIAGDDEVNGFTKVDVREKVNWKEEGF
jgi:hypothetical protein